MEFFEFFFSGPNWGWKAFALILLVNVIFNGIVEIIKAIFKGKHNDNMKATIDDFQ